MTDGDFQFQIPNSHRWIAQTSIFIFQFCFFNLNVFCLFQVWSRNFSKFVAVQKVSPFELKISKWLRNIYLLWVKKTSQVNKLFCSWIVRLFCGFFSKLQSIFFFQFQTLISRSVFFFKFQLPTLHLSFAVPYLFFSNFKLQSPIADLVKLQCPS